VTPPKYQRDPEPEFIAYCHGKGVAPTVRQHGQWMRVRAELAERAERAEVERRRALLEELKRITERRERAERNLAKVLR
jgi:hypothetical protein